MSELEVDDSIKCSHYFGRCTAPFSPFPSDRGIRNVQNHSRGLPGNGIAPYALMNIQSP